MSNNKIETKVKKKIKKIKTIENQTTDSQHLLVKL